MELSKSSKEEEDRTSHRIEKLEEQTKVVLVDLVASLMDPSSAYLLVHPCRKTLQTRRIESTVKRVRRRRRRLETSLRLKTSKEDHDDKGIFLLV